MNPNPLVTWQYEQIEAECALLTGHATDPACPCDSDTENCIRKHLLTIEALAKETYPMDISDQEKQGMADLADQARAWRKQIEQYTINPGSPEPANPKEPIRTEEEIVAEALEILESKVKTTEQMRRLIQLSQELEKRLAASPPDNPGEVIRTEELEHGAGEVRIYREQGEFHAGSLRTIKPDEETLILVGCPVDRATWQNQECLCRATGERGCTELHSITKFS